VKRRVLGSLVGVAAVAVVTGVIGPFRDHVTVATVALVLVVPVVVGAVVGGFAAGAISVIVGFLAFDIFFVPPYGTLSVGTPENWTALVVYVAVMLLVARVVDALERARIETSRGQEVLRRVSEVSELLVGDQPVSSLLTTIVSTARTVFNVPGVALLELEEGRLVVVASAGEPLSPDELRQLDPHSGQPVRVGTAPGTVNSLRTVALSSSGRPMGILAMRGVPIADADRAALNTFANDAALALERAELREQALRTQLLEEAERFRKGLLGAVSHDLRTPLATLKVASSTLWQRGEALSAHDARELLQLIEIQADRLTRLVTNLLDMTRIEAGVLTLHKVAGPVQGLIDEALVVMSPALGDLDVVVSVAETLPPVTVDPTLMTQVFVNLLDNAIRHSPPGGIIRVDATWSGSEVHVAVSDQGSGVAPADRETIFDRFTQLSTGGRAGLGLTIVKTFVEAHGERVWYEDVATGGARFVVSLPLARNSGGG